MARPLRIEYPGAFYHVMNRGLERRVIFRDRLDYQAFLHRCLEVHNRFKVIFHAYSLMPNHYHLMMETPAENLSRAMRHLDSVYTQGFNHRKERRVGPLFQGRYKAILIDKDAYALELSRYIHLNPVKAKIVNRPEDHAYSSFRYYVGRRALRDANSPRGQTGNYCLSPMGVKCQDLTPFSGYLSNGNSF